MIPMVDLKRQYHSLKRDIDAAISNVLEDTRFILGPNVSALEEEVAAYHGPSQAVGVANGTMPCFWLCGPAALKPVTRSLPRPLPLSQRQRSSLF